MRILTFAGVIMSLFGVMSGQEFLSTTRCVYGNENSIEGGAQFVDKPILLAKKEGKSSDSISEQDIIITVDEFGNEQDKKKEGGDSISEDDIIILHGEPGKEHEKVVEINREKKKNSTNILDLALGYIEKGEKNEARNLLSELYFKETDNKRKNKIKAALDKLNAELVFSMAPSNDAIFYVVRQGDTLGKIALRFGVPYESIMRINNKSRSIIRDGERLKILSGELSLLVDKSDFTLTMLLDGHYIKQYPIGIGMFDKTPAATFTTKNKLENPVWYSPDGVYEYGDPNNLLGTRWIGFEDKDGFYGYGIHGTTEPETIGKAMSNGCIRLRNEDVEELYDYVSIKTKVVIQE